MLNRALCTALPMAIAASWVLATFAEVQAPVAALWRPLAVAGLAGAVIALLGRLVSRDWPTMTMAAAAATALLVGAQPVAIGLALGAVVLVAIRMRERAGGERGVTEGVAGAVGFAGAVYLALTTVNAIAALQVEGPDPSDDPTGVVARPDAPDIYLVLLDGYPRADTLDAEFDIDNGAFERELTERGFSVASTSTSNYSATHLTLASMLHMRHAHEIPGLVPAPEEPGHQYRMLTARINDGVALRILRDAGYHVVTSVSAVSDTSLYAADEVLDGGQITLFEDQLLRLSLAGRIVNALARDWLADQQRDRVLANLRHVAEVAERDSPGPTFMLTHVMLPHPPHVFDEGGQPRDLPRCYPIECQPWESRARLLQLSEGEYATSLAGQLEHTNQLVLAAVDDLAAKPEAVVILFADHGTRYRDDLPAEHFRTFFAARTPGQPDLFDDDVCLVNVLGLTFQAYLGLPFEPLPCDRWLTEWPILQLSDQRGTD